MGYEITTHPLRGVEATPGSGRYGIFDHGAHIWSYQPDGQAPVVWMSEKSWYSDGQPVRGGVPVCFPWFGPGRSGDLQPIHGFARLSTWHMSDIKDTIERDGRLMLDLEDPEGQRLTLVDDGGAGESFPWDRSPVPAAQPAAASPRPWPAPACPA